MDGETTDQIPVFSSGHARKRPVVTTGAHADQDIFTLGLGFVAFGSNVQVPSRGPRVPVMQAANLRNRYDSALAWRLNLARHRSVPVKREMGA